jgi:DNA-binding MarR family transcriptional regulator
MQTDFYGNLANEVLENWQILSRVGNSGFGIITPEIVTLMCLDQKCNSTPKEISQYLGVTPARVAVLLKSLEKQGLIDKRPQDEDKRFFVVCLTKQGVELLAQRKENFVFNMCALLQDLGEEDAANYVRIMKKVINIKLRRKADGTSCHNCGCKLEDK